MQFPELTLLLLTISVAFGVESGRWGNTQEKERGHGSCDALTPLGFAGEVKVVEDLACANLDVYGSAG